MLDLFYVYIFGKFYFYESDFLVNHTDCLNMCIEREMKLPNANDNQFIVRQLASQFGSRFEKEIQIQIMPGCESVYTLINWRKSVKS